jgi:hypothetical protein
MAPWQGAKVPLVDFHFVLISLLHTAVMRRSAAVGFDGRARKKLGVLSRKIAEFGALEGEIEPRKVEAFAQRGNRTRQEGPTIIRPRRHWHASLGLERLLTSACLSHGPKILPPGVGVLLHDGQPRQQGSVYRHGSARREGPIGALRGYGSRCGIGALSGRRHQIRRDPGAIAAVPGRLDARTRTPLMPPVETGQDRENGNLEDEPMSEKNRPRVRSSPVHLVRKRVLPAKLRQAVHHNDRSAHRSTWDGEAPKKPMTLPTVHWLSRPDPWAESELFGRI